MTDAAWKMLLRSVRQACMEVGQNKTNRWRVIDGVVREWCNYRRTLLVFSLRHFS